VAGLRARLDRRGSGRQRHRAHDRARGGGAARRRRLGGGRSRRRRALRRGPPDRRGAVVSPAPRILVIEDNADLAQGIAYNLQLEGYEVRIAPDGRSGLDAALLWAPDVVLLELTLPGLEGFYGLGARPEEHTSELQSHSDVWYAVFCLKKKFRLDA